MTIKKTVSPYRTHRPHNTPIKATKSLYMLIIREEAPVLNHTAHVGLKY